MTSEANRHFISYKTHRFVIKLRLKNTLLIGKFRTKNERLNYNPGTLKLY